jgi:hypothetical protein
VPGGAVDLPGDPVSCSVDYQGLRRRTAIDMDTARYSTVLLAGSRSIVPHPAERGDRCSNVEGDRSHLSEIPVVAERLDSHYRRWVDGPSVRPTSTATNIASNSNSLTRLPLRVGAKWPRVIQRVGPCHDHPAVSAEVTVGALDA